jgi:DNA-binding LacI/PurR family transcriptional regulator
MRVTRDDVAKMAGVSTATVSYVINNKRKISENIRKRVLDAVATLNYKPDMIARSMVTNETMQLGLVLESISNPFFGEIIHGFENAANEKGYFVNICTGFNKLDDYFDNFISRRLDGVFIMAMPPKFHIEKVYNLVDHGVKVIMSGDTEADIKKVSSIESDYVEAMDNIIAHLVSLGHRNIAFISGLSRNHKFDMRIPGYLKALEKYKIDIGEKLLFDGTPPYTTDIEDGVRQTNRLIDSGLEFSAIACLNDLMAIGAIKACQQSGLRIPQDISIVGIDGIPFADVWNPPLTTMVVPRFDFGAKAFELLYTNIRQGNTGFFMSKLQLAIRQSTSEISQERNKKLCQ